MNDVSDRWDRGKKAGLEHWRRRLPWMRTKLLFILALSAVTFLVLWVGLELGFID
jgi:hypothetical protein